MAGGVVALFPASIQDIIQRGLIERAYYDSLMPNLLFRAEAEAEEIVAHVGDEITQTKSGLLDPITTPTQPGVDPPNQTTSREQWKVRIDQYTGSLDIHVPTSALASVNLFLQDIGTLGRQAAQSANRLPRNALFKSYLGGWTATTASALISATQIPVASINGFFDVMNTSIRLLPQPVSSTNPLQIRIGTNPGAITAFVIAALPADAADPFGPGILVLRDPLPSAVAARTVVVSKFAPRVVRTGGGDSVDAISGGDTLVLQDVINGAALLRDASVPAHEDGTYHAHIPPLTNAQLFADPVYQRLNQSLPNGQAYTTGVVPGQVGVTFFMNQEAPYANNCGPRKATGTNAQYSRDIGAETTNDSAVDVGRVIITGRGSLFERYVDEAKNYTSDAGVSGKIGTFDVMSNGVAINTERIRLIMRAPQDKLQQMVTCTWSFTTGFSAPTDVLAQSGPERYKRALVLEHAR